MATIRRCGRGLSVPTSAAVPAAPTDVGHSLVTSEYLAGPPHLGQPLGCLTRDSPCPGVLAISPQPRRQHVGSIPSASSLDRSVWSSFRWPCPQGFSSTYFTSPARCLRTFTSPGRPCVCRLRCIAPTDRQQHQAMSARKGSIDGVNQNRRSSSIQVRCSSPPPKAAPHARHGVFIGAAQEVMRKSAGAARSKAAASPSALHLAAPIKTAWRLFPVNGLRSGPPYRSVMSNPARSSRLSISWGKVYRSWSGATCMVSWPSALTTRRTAVSVFTWRSSSYASVPLTRTVPP
jgi:hypothetical protein